MSNALFAGLRRMTSRDPHEVGRVASALELLYDLTFVIAVGIAASHLAETVAGGHVGLGLLGFAFAMMATFITWINFSWLNSAFDVDDWMHRVQILVQMAGVVLLAIGLDAMFDSLQSGGRMDIRLLVAGYVVMRVSLVAMWARIAVQVPEHRGVALRNIVGILVAQVGWVILAIVAPVRLPFFLMVVLLGVFELLIPLFAQGAAGSTPWHRHHIAERYSAFAIITLGEGVVGTVEAAREALAGHGSSWTVDAGLLVAIGLGATFGLWWTYFLVPFGEYLHHRPGRGYVFGYGHVPVLMSIAATGAGIHIVGLYIEHHSVLGPVGTALALVIPLACFLAALQAVLAGMRAPGVVGGRWLLLAFALLGLSVLLTVLGVPVLLALLVAVTALFVPVIGEEISRCRQ